MIDPAECRRLAAEIQSDLDSGPEVNPYEITWGAASAIASALTDAAELAERCATLETERDHWHRARNTALDAGEILLEQRDAARAEVEHWRKARETALEAGEILKAEVERLRAGICGILEWPQVASGLVFSSVRSALRALLEVAK